MDRRVIDRNYVAYGGAAELFRSGEKEVLCESGAGTGKSFSLMQMAKYRCLKYPGSRHVFARETRKALTESILPDWDARVLWRGHPAIGRARRSHRDSYEFPNGSIVVLHSLENVDRILSAQFDSISIFQAEELQDEDIWDKMTTRLRYGVIPKGQIIGDVNPAADTHWLNRRADRKICWPCSEGVGRPGRMPTIIEMDEEWGPPTCPLCRKKVWKYQMHRILFRHEDNPLWYDWEKQEWTPEGREYIGNTLGRLKGVQRERLLKHRWVSEAGVILDEWDPKVHMIDGRLYGPGEDPGLIDCPHWRLHVHNRKEEFPEPVTLIKFGAGVDWGFHPDPGVISTWGYDDQGRRFLVDEVIRLREQIEWWASTADDLRKRYGIEFFACDPSRPDYIEAFNLRMTPRFGRSRPIAVGANNKLRAKAKSPGKDLVGIDLMRWGLRDPNGVVRTFVLRETARLGIDKEMRRQNRPIGFAQEVTAWVYDKDADGQELERPDPSCDEHALDAARYEASIGWFGIIDVDESIRGGPKPGSIRAMLWDE